MPVYEYECTKCGQRFELRRGMADRDDEIRCPRCGAESPRRVFSVFATGSSSGGCAPSSST
ncbi:MAG: zinc ribbon domain-containing protein [Dehalococcoidia bacterium]|nr:MAG: zinc ribbon domain-containing protein [Dehalococcoidia bacterium]